MAFLELSTIVRMQQKYFKVFSISSQNRRHYLRIKSSYFYKFIKDILKWNWPLFILTCWVATKTVTIVIFCATDLIDSCYIMSSLTPSAQMLAAFFNVLTSWYYKSKFWPGRCPESISGIPRGLWPTRARVTQHVKIYTYET